MHLTNDQIQDVLGVLAGILHLGNVSFVQAGGAQVADKAGMVQCTQKIAYSELCIIPTMYQSFCAVLS